MNFGLLLEELGSAFPAGNPVRYEECVVKEFRGSLEILTCYKTFEGLPQEKLDTLERKVFFENLMLVDKLTWKGVEWLLPHFAKGFFSYYPNAECWDFTQRFSMLFHPSVLSVGHRRKLEDWTRAMSPKQRLALRHFFQFLETKSKARAITFAEALRFCVEWLKPNSPPPG